MVRTLQGVQTTTKHTSYGSTFVSTWAKVKVGSKDHKGQATASVTKRPHIIAVGAGLLIRPLPLVDQSLTITIATSMPKYLATVPNPDKISTLSNGKIVAQTTKSASANLPPVGNGRCFRQLTALLFIITFTLSHRIMRKPPASTLQFVVVQQYTLK